MNLSIKWLRDYIKADMSVEELSRGMTMSGSKVEKWVDLSAPLEKIVVGKVAKIEKHADSEKLWVAQVDVGSGVPVQIVTGAQNVTEGAFVPVVLAGGVVHNRADGSAMKIKPGKLRGVESMGMMCSFDELGLTHDDLPYADPDGILLLDQDPDAESLKEGMDVVEFLGIKDIAVEFEITNNRPDCLSVIGLAREAGATFNLPLNLKPPAFSGKCQRNEEARKSGDCGNLNLNVTVENKELCSRYMAAVVKNVKIEPSPRFITERLRASGVRPINNIVDITNFVMLEYGHPMHAFDKRYVGGDKIIVRNAYENEKITLLDGEERVLTAQTLVIADAEKPIAVAGVMGGEYSGIMPDTAEIVFESACFDGVSVRKTAQRIGRRTESSSRFEKGIDPANAETALLRALELIEQLNCGQVVKTIIDENFSDRNPVRIKHDPKKINAILGSDIPWDKQIEILTRLSFKYENGSVIVPGIRTDVRLECDLAEEVARIYGYNEIPSSLPRLVSGAKVSAEEVFERKAGLFLQGQGCFETATFSFISPKTYAKAGISENSCKSVVIRNPLGEETGVMRASMLPSMLGVIAHNYNNRNDGGRFYEIGRLYLPRELQENDEKPNLPDEIKALCIGTYGEDEDFLSLKGIIEELLGRFGVEYKFSALTTNKSYHTGRCAEITTGAEITSGGEIIGVMGEIHPFVAESFGIGTRAYVAEINIKELIKHSRDVAKYKSLPRFPSMKRDLSLLCDKNITAGEICEIIVSSAKNLEDVRLFDMYSGEQIPDGMKSLSYKLVFRKADSTLTDDETDAVITKILKALEQKNIKLR